MSKWHPRWSKRGNALRNRSSKTAQVLSIVTSPTNNRYVLKSRKSNGLSTVLRCAVAWVVANYSTVVRSLPYFLQSTLLNLLQYYCTYDYRQTKRIDYGMKLPVQKKSLEGKMNLTEDSVIYFRTGLREIPFPSPSSLLPNELLRHRLP